MKIIIISVRTKMPIMDAVNQQVLSFNVYLIAILHADTFAHKNAHAHTREDTCSLLALSITHLFFRRKILPQFCMRKISNST